MFVQFKAHHILFFFSVAPQFVTKPTRTIIEEGRNVTWTCSATGKPRPRITWSKARGALPSESVVTEDGSLTLTNITKADGGLYTCHADNLLGRVTASEQLMVFSALKFTLKPPEKIIGVLGAAVELPCAASSDLQLRVYWKHNGNTNLPSGVLVRANGSLVIPNLSKSLEGNYSCIAQNAVNSLEASSHVQFKGHYRSCSAIKKSVSSSGLLVSVKSGSYVIDPDDEGGVAPFTVFCDMSDKNGVGVTVIGHDSESRTLVDGCDTEGCYSRDVTYNGASLSQLSSLTAVSAHCEQFIKYECFGSRLILDNFAWWMSRDGFKMTFWGGASPGSGKCACGMSNSCADSSYGCNCDKNDDVWREDSGLLTDKSSLPVSQLRFGDVSSGEQGYHILGKLKCYGMA